MSWGEIGKALNSTVKDPENFAPLDELITGGCQTFTESGTFVVPKGVKYIFVTACAGGGGGGWTARYGASGGAGGACVFRKRFDVSNLREIQVVVGDGGDAAPSSNGKGLMGGATVIGNLITLQGGEGGDYTSSSGVTAQKAKAGNEWAGDSGQDGVVDFSLGFNGRSGEDIYDGGGSLGKGGLGNVESGDGTADGKLGGGGGGANTWNASSRRPGKGGDGIVIIEWGASAL